MPFSQAERDELVDEYASAQNSNSRKAFNQHLKKLKVSVDCFSHATLAVCAWLITLNPKDKLVFVPNSDATQACLYCFFATPSTSD